jgi:hypothetical protein
MICPSAQAGRVNLQKQGYTTSHIVQMPDLIGTVALKNRREWRKIRKYIHDTTRRASLGALGEDDCYGGG